MAERSVRRYRGDRLVVAPRAFASLSLDRVRVMGVVNVTPDSFSDGGETFAAEAAVARGLAMVRAGADLIDVGGESTRPGAEPVAEPEELRRVIPVVAALARTGVLVSVDTRRAAVMDTAIASGASIVNDVTALSGDPRALATVARSHAAVILMHMQGEPRTMQRAPIYAEVASDVYEWLQRRIRICLAAGISSERIAVDPGIGFGKSVVHNLEILSRLEMYRSCGHALVVGVSRKSFIARLSRDEPPLERLAGSLAAGLAAVARGANILRVHDVAETRQALRVWEGIDGRSWPER